MVKLSVAVLLSILFLCSCNENPVNNGLEVFYPSLKVYKPSPNDTVPLGRHEIIYDVSDPKGIATYELVVNDSVVSVFDVKPGMARPAIFWEVGATSLNSRMNVYLRAYDIDRNEIRSATVTNILVGDNMSPPGAPYKLSLTWLSVGTINLFWNDSSSNEDAFELWRKRGDDPYQTLKILPKNAVSTNDTGLSASIRYKYKVRAVNRYGYSESNEVSTNPDSLTGVVAQPTDLRAAALSTTSVQLSWTDNADNDLAYIVERKNTSGVAFTRIAVLPSNQTSYVDRSGVFSGTSYTYRVAALGQFGQSLYSNEATALTLYQDINPPSNLLASYISSPRGVVLTWSDNSVLETETRIERRIDSTGLFIDIGRTGVDTTFFRDPFVESGHSYFYRVRILTVDQRYSAYSNVAPVVVPTGSTVLMIGGNPQKPERIVVAEGRASN